MDHKQGTITQCIRWEHLLQETLLQKGSFYKDHLHRQDILPNIEM